jgi:hypothetical protein
MSPPPASGNGVERVFHAYRAYGLDVASAFRIPELERDAGCFPVGRGDPPGILSTHPEVEVHLEPVPEAADDPRHLWFFVRPDGTAILRICGVATFAMRGGRTIHVGPEPIADPTQLRLRLLGSAFAILLHQRGALPLSASAVMVAGRAWAFVAPPGTGKPTLAAELHLHAGLPLVSGDVAVLDPREAAEPSIRVDAGFPGAPPVPLAGLVMLERDAEGVEGGVVLRRLGGPEALLAAKRAIRRFEFGVGLTSMGTMFDRLGWLTEALPIWRGRMGDPDPAHPGRRERALRTFLECPQEHRSL